MNRIVVKVGSHVLSNHESLAIDRIRNLTKFLSQLMKKYEVILVSSGAVAAGFTKLQIDKSNVANRQAIAAVGQPYLVSVYQKKLEKFGIIVAQVLLTADDFDSRSRTKHAKDAINRLIENSVLPIINENDTTATEELVFGDNDQLSAHVAYYFDADMLVILSDIDGYYDLNPRENSNAKMYKIVDKIDDKDLDVAFDPNHSFATGGIATKLKAANFLLKRDREMFMASGFDLEDAKSFLLENKHLKGTLFSKRNKK